MLSLSREATICMPSWRTHKDTAHAKAAEWIRRMISVYTHPSSYRFMSLRHGRTRFRAQQRAFQKFFCPCFIAPFWFNETYLKGLLNQNSSLLRCSVQTVAQMSWYIDHFAEWMLCLSLYNLLACNLQSVTQQENKWLFTLEQIAEAFSSVPCLHFLLVSVETLKPFRLLIISAKEMTS